MTEQPRRGFSSADFYIGAHAAVTGRTLLTRDAERYRTKLPTLALSCPCARRPRLTAHGRGSRLTAHGQSVATVDEQN